MTSDLPTVVHVPEPEKPKRKWELIADKARQAAPEWVVIEDASAAQASRIRKGQIPAFPDPERWDVTTRNNTRNNKCTIYLRYNHY